MFGKIIKKLLFQIFVVSSWSSCFYVSYRCEVVPPNDAMEFKSIWHLHSYTTHVHCWNVMCVLGFVDKSKINFSFANVLRRIFLFGICVQCWKGFIFSIICVRECKHSQVFSVCELCSLAHRMHVLCGTTPFLFEQRIGRVCSS